DAWASPPRRANDTLAKADPGRASRATRACAECRDDGPVVRGGRSGSGRPPRAGGRPERARAVRRPAARRLLVTAELRARVLPRTGAALRPHRPLDGAPGLAGAPRPRAARARHPGTGARLPRAGRVRALRRARVAGARARDVGADAPRALATRR